MAAVDRGRLRNRKREKTEAKTNWAKHNNNYYSIQYYSALLLPLLFTIITINTATTTIKASMSVIEELEKHDFLFSGARLDKPSFYLMKKAKRSAAGLQDLEKSIKSSTIYVGNLSFFTTEEQIYELFNKCGEIRQIIMGLDRFQKTPCGFCFVIYETRQMALNCVKYLTGSKLDNQALEIDVDPGFEEGRQFGRGKSGGQVKDEYFAPTTYDGFGGFNPGFGFQPEPEQGFRPGERRHRGEADSYVPGQEQTEPEPEPQQWGRYVK